MKPEEEITTYEEAWAFCQREGVVFSVWSDGTGGRSLMTATLRGESPDAWRNAMLGLVRRLKEREDERDGAPSSDNEDPDSGKPMV